jgi:hypothetical protein
LDPVGSPSANSQSQPEFAFLLHLEKPPHKMQFCKRFFGVLAVSILCPFEQAFEVVTHSGHEQL